MTPPVSAETREADAYFAEESRMKTLTFKQPKLRKALKRLTHLSRHAAKAPMTGDEVRRIADMEGIPSFRDPLLKLADWLDAMLAEPSA